MTEKRNVYVRIGIVALILLAALLGMGIALDLAEMKKAAAGRTEASPAAAVSFSFEPDILVYDGSRPLDLMTGVRAVSEEGTDLTKEISAVMVSGETLERKKVRYSVFWGNQRATAVRELWMTGYTGPELTVTKQLNLTAEELTNLVQVLKQRGELTADNGFSADASRQVSWFRKRIGAGKYLLTFTLRNEYNDVAMETAVASISGEISDISLALTTEEITVTVGERLFPLRYVAAASDPELGDISDGLQVNDQADTSQPGIYSVYYTLLSPDGTQEAEAELRVRVVEQ